MAVITHKYRRWR